MSNLTKNWNTARIIRLIANIAVAVYGITTQDYIFLWLAGFLLLQSLFNLSCCACGSGDCSSNSDKNIKAVYKDQIKTFRPEKGDSL